MRTFGVLVALLCLPTLGHAAVRRVPSEYPTITAAVTAANHGDTILVSDGLYGESVDLNKCLTLESEYGPEVTTIDAGGAEYAVRFSGGIPSTGWSVIGFTLTGATNGVSVRGDVLSPRVIAGCILTGNSCGVSASQYGVTVTDCVITDGHTGIYVLADAYWPYEFIGNIIWGNAGTGVLISCLECDYTLEHNTIAANGCGVHITRVSPGGSGLISSNIVTGNGNCGLSVVRPFAPPDCTFIRYNDIWDNGLDIPDACSGEVIGFNGNISADPVFCSGSTGDFTLSEDSPCAGAGEGDTDIGAMGVACGPQAGVATPERDVTWSTLKSIYR